MTLHHLSQASGRPTSAGRRRATTRRRELVVIGRGSRARAIVRRVERLRLRVRSSPHVDAARASLSETVAAVVIVAPLPEIEISDVVPELRGPANARAVFVVVPESFSERRARRIYEAGAHAMFSWPRDALVLPTMISELLQAPPRKGRRGVDAALARGVRARLQLAEDGRLRARIADGVVTLHGFVTSYWKKVHLVDSLSQIPGVTGVHCEKVEVVPVQRPDAELRRSVRRVLASVGGDQGRALRVSVDDGIVRLRGTVSRHGETERLVDVVGQVEGVRGIIDDIGIASSTDETRRITSRLRKRIGALFPDARAAVTVFGYIAIIDGHVSTLSDKRAIGELARGTPGIGRVVNKLTVTR